MGKKTKTMLKATGKIMKNKFKVENKVDVNIIMKSLVFSENIMKKEDEEISETGSVRRQFTSPELIDHDYWMIEDKNSSAEQVNGVAVDHRSGEDPAFHRFFVCHFCGNTWSNLSQLMLHLKSTHPSELEVDVESHTIYNLGISQVHSCLYCNYTTELFDFLVDHIKTYHRVVSDHCCPHCEYRSMMKASLKDHLFQKHRHTCVFCLLNIHV